MLKAPEPPPFKFLEYFCNYSLFPGEVVAFFLAALTLAFGIGLLVKPKLMMAGMKAFPRHIPLGIILTAICVPWFSLLLYYNIPFPGVERFRPQLVIGSLVLFFPICYYMKDLLSVRALGCFFLLLGVPVIMGVRYEPGVWQRWVVVTWMYVLVVISIIFVYSPWRFRRWTNRFLVPDRLRRPIAAAITLVGVLLAVVGGYYLSV